MKAQTEAQGEASIIQAKYQARSQEAFQEAQGSTSAGQAGMEGQAQSGDGAAPPAEGQQQAGQEQAQQQPEQADLGADQQMSEQANQQMAAQQQAPVQGQAGEQAGGQVVQLDAARVAKNWANRLSQMAPEERERALADMRSKMPNMARLVEQLLTQMSSGETAGDAADRMKPLPQSKPPRRDSSPV
jgi:hypothetical protein